MIMIEPRNTAPRDWREAAQDELDVLFGVDREATFYVADVVNEIDNATRYWNDRLYRRVDQCVKYAGAIALQWLTEYHQGDFFELYDELVQLLMQRQAKYGHKNILKHGEFGVLVRMADKAARLENMQDEHVDFDDESVVDAWMDIVGYAVIFGMCSADTFTLDLPEDN